MLSPEIGDTSRAVDHLFSSAFPLIGPQNKTRNVNPLKKQLQTARDKSLVLCCQQLLVSIQSCDTQLVAVYALQSTTVLACTVMRHTTCGCVCAAKHHSACMYSHVLYSNSPLLQVCDTVDTQCHAGKEGKV